MRIRKKASRTNALSVLRQIPPGSALYEREQIDHGAWEVAWLIREESARIAQLGPSPDIEFRAAAIEHNGVLLIPVLVRVGPEHQESIYETWINAQQPEQAGMQVLGELAIQPRLVVHLYGDGCRRVRSLRVSNPHQAFFREVLSTLRERPAWSMAEFDDAREQIYQQYPSVSDLWKGLQS